MQNLGQTMSRECEVACTSVIASEAKQSISPRKEEWIASVALLLAMTTFPEGPVCPPNPAFQFCNRSHVDIDIPDLASAI
jgi:hypothetical protein